MTWKPNITHWSYYYVYQYTCNAIQILAYFSCTFLLRIHIYLDHMTFNFDLISSVVVAARTFRSFPVLSFNSFCVSAVLRSSFSAEIGLTRLVSFSLFIGTITWRVERNTFGRMANRWNTVQADIVHAHVSKFISHDSVYVHYICTRLSMDKTCMYYRIYLWRRRGVQ